MKKPMIVKAAFIAFSLLPALLALAIIPGGAASKEVSDVGPLHSIAYSFVDDTDTLYLLDSNVFYAIGGDGELKWTYHMPYDIPGQWNLVTSFSDSIVPATAVGNGTVYVYLKPTYSGFITDGFRTDGILVAISDGRKLWEIPLECRAMGLLIIGGFDDEFDLSDVRILAKGDRVYVFHDSNETIISRDGTVLWNVEGVSDPAAVDEEGFVYCVRAADLQDTGYAFMDRDTTGVIDAYGPDGKLCWERRADSPLVRQPRVGSPLPPLPVYHNGTIYALMADGVTAYGRDGTERWTRTYDLGEFKFDDAPDAKATLRLYSLMPFDSEGNLYLQCTSTSDLPIGSYIYSGKMYLIVIGPDGNEISRSYLPANTYSNVQDGIAYVESGSPACYTPSGLTELPIKYLSVVDVKSGKELWNATFSPGNVTVVTVDEASAFNLFGYNATIEAMNAENGGYKDTRSIIGAVSLGITRGKDIVYVTYEPRNYENPVVFGQSKCAYTGGIYAFTTDGVPLWFQPVDLANQTRQHQRQWVSKNGTVFYLTPDGKVGVLGVGAAAGLTLTALYFFYHFFCAGAVTRAKARLGKNENRNRILDFIAQNPGSTLYEISRGTGLNLGTVKYHSFILGVNHKIVTSRMDGKYVRYFTNSRSYTKDEQLVLSLMRRDAIGRVLGLILEKPGISNAEIARELGIQDSVVCRCVKELSEKGVIAREVNDESCANSIRDSYHEPIVAAVKRMQGQ